jgi:HK97 gp10 family phage protein
MANLRHIKGLDEFQRALEQLPKNIARNVLRGAVNAGASVLRKEAEARAPVYAGDDPRVEPGRIRENVYQKHIPQLSNELLQTYYVGVRAGKRAGKYKVVIDGKTTYLDAFYWWWVEFGHFYVPPGIQKNKGSTPWNKRHREAAHLAGVWVEARPFIRPTFHTKKDEAIDAMVDYMARRIPKEAEKLGLVMR